MDIWTFPHSSWKNSEWQMKLGFPSSSSEVTTHAVWLAWIKALYFTDRATAVREEADHWLDGPISRPCEPQGAWESAQSVTLLALPWLRVLTSLELPGLASLQSASVAPAVRIRGRINASGGGDPVNPAAATAGHRGLDGRPKTPSSAQRAAER